MSRSLRIATVIMPVLFAACSSPPEAPPDLDREAKQFVTHPEDGPQDSPL